MLLRNIKRAPMRTIAMLLFATVISVIICALQASNEAELRNYEETWKSVPVTATITEPSGSITDQLFITTWVYDLFTDEEPVQFYDISGVEDPKKNPSEIFRIQRETDPVEMSLTEYVKDIQVKCQHTILSVNGKEFKNELIGLTSLPCDKQLLPEYGCEIKWNDGYDESIFCGEDSVCIVPEGMAEYYDNGNGETVLYFYYDSGIKIVDGEAVKLIKEYQCTLKIVGTYTAGDEKSIYCPYPIIERVFTELEKERYQSFRTLSVTLADNNRLEEFREKISFCFLEPSSDDNIYFGKLANGYICEYYTYALDINDENLFDLSAILKDSIQFNRKVTLIVVALSAVSGFLVGFLMIRRRKREIMLMRMVGESNFRVYCGFAIEQMLCIILGIALGGAYYKWNPINNLAIFAITYFVALTLALVIFMSKKLIKNVKEDE